MNTHRSFERTLAGYRPKTFKLPELRLSYGSHAILKPLEVSRIEIMRSGRSPAYEWESDPQTQITKTTNTQKPMRSSAPGLWVRERPRPCWQRKGRGHHQALRGCGVSKRVGQQGLFRMFEQYTLVSSMLGYLCMIPYVDLLSILSLSFSLSSLLLILSLLLSLFRIPSLDHTVRAISWSWIKSWELKANRLI